MNEINQASYLSHFDPVISKEICDYATDYVFLSSRYIFYTNIDGLKKQRQGYCTHCKSTFITEGLKNNSLAICPVCKSECIVKSSKVHRKYLCDEAYFIYFEKSIKDPDTIVARGIYAFRDYGGDYKQVETMYSMRTMYIFQIGQPVMLQNTYWYGSRRENYEKRKTVYSLFDSQMAYDRIQKFCSYASIRKAVDDTPFRYSCYEDYLKGNDERDMVTFFNLYCKYPKVVEYITKAVGTSLIEDKLAGDHTYSALNWRGKTLFKMLRMDRRQVKECVKERIQLSFSTLKIIQMAKEDSSKFTIKQMQEFGVTYSSNFEDLQAMIKHIGFRKAINYLNKQLKKSGSNVYRTANSALNDWRDYISECVKLGMDTTNHSVLFPPNLHQAHLNTTRQITILQNKELDQKIAKRAKNLSKKYSYTHQGLFIRPAASSIELIDEGKTLNHCVGTYGNRYGEGKTDILFIRKVSDPDTPYFTMEIRDNSIIQTRGIKNINPTEEVEAFIKTFNQAKLSKSRRTTKDKITRPA